MDRRCLLVDNAMVEEEPHGSHAIMRRHAVLDFLCDLLQVNVERSAVRARRVSQQRDAVDRNGPRGVSNHRDALARSDCLRHSILVAREEIIYGLRVETLLATGERCIIEATTDVISVQ